MPTIPTYEGPQLRQQGVPDAYQQNQDISSNKISQGLDRLTDVADKIDQQNATTKAYQVETKLRTDWLETDQKLREQYRGDKADLYKEAATKWWAEAPSKYGEGLDPRSQMLASRSIMQARVSAAQTSNTFYTEEKEKSTQGAWIASKATDLRSAANDVANSGGDPALIAKAAGVYTQQLTQKNAAEAARRGLTADQLAALNVADLTSMHSSVVDSLKGKDPTAALNYIKSVPDGQIEPEARAKLVNSMNVLSAENDGDNAAKTAWTGLGPKGPNDPVNLVAMKADVDKQYPNDPVRRKAAHAAINEMAQDHNRTQAEFQASSVNNFYGDIGKGVPVRKALATALSNGMTNETARKLEHTLTLEAQARDSRDIARMQKAEQLLRLQGADVYHENMNPDVLAEKSRDQVSALRGTIGIDRTTQLLSTWDSMQTKEGKATAKMASETFNVAAQELGLNPNKQTKTESEKDALNFMHERMNVIADRMAKQNPRVPVTQEMLKEQMRKEMAVQITLNPGMFSSNKTVAAFSVQDKDLAKVVIPEAEKAAIRSRLEADFARDPKNPRYALTADNISRVYLAIQRRKALNQPSPTDATN